LSQHSLLSQQESIKNNSEFKSKSNMSLDILSNNKSIQDDDSKSVTSIVDNSSIETFEPFNKFLNFCHKLLQHEYVLFNNLFHNNNFEKSNQDFIKSSIKNILVNMISVQTQPLADSISFIAKTPNVSGQLIQSIVNLLINFQVFDFNINWIQPNFNEQKFTNFSIKYKKDFIQVNY
jgi:hypothetical protein